MIELTRLNGSALVINSDLIKCAESSPDTMLTLIHGEKIVVREPCSEVIERVIAYRARLLSEVVRLSGTSVNTASLSCTRAAALGLEGDAALTVDAVMTSEVQAAAKRRRNETL